MSIFHPTPLFFFFFFLLFSTITSATVPPSSTFKFQNTGSFGDYITEYDANYRTLSIFTSPFQLCFYNTTPNAYTLALRMGLTRSESLFRWVWEANRSNPVSENATLTFGSDGNLILTDSDGRIAWQTKTDNKGVVGFKLLPNGNMVLHDRNGKFIWQSFDYPTDTLLVGQYLSVMGPSKLVSRKSAVVNANGRYSFVMESKNRSVGMYYNSSSSSSNSPLLYYTMNDVVVSGTSLKRLTFQSTPESDAGDDDKPYAWNLVFAVESSSTSSSGGSTLQIARPKYNATASFLRLGIDGNLKVYTYNDKVDWQAWEVTFSLFARESSYALWDTECQLPEKCGEFGVCDENSQCVACPTAPSGVLLGWSKNCRPPMVNGCGTDKGRKYFKVDGVEHFTSKYTAGVGPVKETECGDKCSKDCKCLGWFYNKGNQRCWIVDDLKTLTKVGNGSSHVGYIKM